MSQLFDTSSFMALMPKDLKYKKLSENAIIPTYGSKDAAGMDLYSTIDITIPVGETVKIPTDIAMSIPKGYGGFIFARSGLATKNGLAPANKVGVVDADYRGNIIVALHNHSNSPQSVFKGDRIAQMVIMPYARFPMVESDSLDETDRDDGGFGSTGQ